MNKESIKKTLQKTSIFSYPIHSIKDKKGNESLPKNSIFSQKIKNLAISKKG